MTAQEINPTGAVTYLKVGDIRKNPDLMKKSTPSVSSSNRKSTSGASGKTWATSRSGDPGVLGVLTGHHTDEGDFVFNGPPLIRRRDGPCARRRGVAIPMVNYTDKDLPGAIPDDHAATGQMKNKGVTPLQARADAAVLEHAVGMRHRLRYGKVHARHWSGFRGLGTARSEHDRQAKTADAAGLAHRSPFLWDEVRRGNLKQPLGVVIVPN